MIAQDAAPPPETVALFVSDLHLQAVMPSTAAAFFHFLEAWACRAQQLYLLGDIFEYWAGDDDDDPFNQQVIEAIRKVADTGVEVFWIAGNRDFLVGDGFAQASGTRLLPDPYVVQIAGQRLVLTHGDAQCTDDTAYMAFRAQVRQPAWQSDFLKRPLAERKAIIAGLRQGSREAQRHKEDSIMDVNAGAIAALYDATSAATMIHGHTHRPALHVSYANDNARTRYVLPDWDTDGDTVRGGWIAIAADGKIVRYDVNGTALTGHTS